jgi:hypothetical protein
MEKDTGVLAMLASDMLPPLTAQLTTAVILLRFANVTTPVSCSFCPGFIFLVLMLDCKELINGASGSTTIIEIKDCAALVFPASVTTNETCPMTPNEFCSADTVKLLAYIEEKAKIFPQDSLKCGVCC